MGPKSETDTEGKLDFIRSGEKGARSGASASLDDLRCMGNSQGLGLEVCASAAANPSAGTSKRGGEDNIYADAQPRQFTEGFRLALQPTLAKTRPELSAEGQETTARLDIPQYLGGQHFVPMPEANGCSTLSGDQTGPFVAQREGVADLAAEAELKAEPEERAGTEREEEVVEEECGNGCLLSSGPRKLKVETETDVSKQGAEKPERNEKVPDGTVRSVEENCGELPATEADVRLPDEIAAVERGLLDVRGEAESIGVAGKGS
jgi:hypothetical protein